MSEWRTTTLGEFIALQRGHDLPQRERRPGSVPVVGSGGITGWHDAAIAPGPGITIGRAANLGVPTFVERDFWPLNTTLYVTDFRGNDIRFTYYLLQTLDLTGFNSGSVQPMLNRNYIKNVPLRVPALSEQRAIASVLGALDDKIALNDRIAASARALGEALYNAYTQDQSSEHTLGEITALLARGIAPRYSEVELDLLILNQRCIRDGRVSLVNARRTTRDKLRPDKLLRRHDVVVNSTGTGTLGRVAICNSDRECTVDTHVTIVRFDPSRVDPLCAAYGMLKLQPYIENLGEGSTGQTELSRSKLANLRVRLPTVEKMRSLRPVLEALEDISEHALDQAGNLQNLRNTLLPALMSGQIRVRDTER